MKINIRIRIYPLIIIGAFLILAAGCKKTDNQPVPVLSTEEVSNITATSATCGGNITSDGGTTVTVRGVCWSTGLTPTTANGKTMDGEGAGSFVSAITGLINNTKYFVRAYATNTAGTGYGSTMSFTTPLTATDPDGNVYHTVTIGTQVWMVENLKTTKYRDGTPIRNVTDNLEWSILLTGAYCNYGNIPSNSDTFGRLYNWFAVVDSRKIAPAGWHVPSDAEWTTLATYLGESEAGLKLKEAGTTHWMTPNTGATNESGFTALPAGIRYMIGTFDSIGMASYLASVTDLNNDEAFSRYLTYELGVFNLQRGYKANGYSVRCLKD